MNREQVKELFKLLVNFYPTFEVTSEKVNAWHKFLQNYEAETIFTNTENHIYENKFPPTVADLVKVNHQEVVVPTVEETKKMLEKYNHYKPASEKVVEEELKKMREILGIKRNDD